MNIIQKMEVNMKGSGKMERNMGKFINLNIAQFKNNTILNIFKEFFLIK